MSLGQGNKIFSSLDLISGYCQMPMNRESREVTAFSIPSCHYEWLRMPFRFKSAPITLQQMINNLFSATPSTLSKNVYVYLDDIIICGNDPESHLATLKAVLLKLKEAGLKIKLSKCEFLKSKITFLGHIVDGHRIHTMDDKILAVKRFPQPQSADNIRFFLGLYGYY